MLALPSTEALTIKVQPALNAVHTCCFTAARRRTPEALVFGHYEVQRQGWRRA